MAAVALFGKMDFLCKEESRNENFLVFSYKLNKHSWCHNSEDADHDLKFCNGACARVRFLLLIIEKFKTENISKKKKKNTFYK